METALAGLDGITELNTHLEYDAFHVVYNPEIVSIGDMQAAIAEAGFEGKVIDPIPPEQRSGVTLDVENLPAKLKSAFDRARELDQLVLIDIHGPG